MFRFFSAVDRDLDGEDDDNNIEKNSGSHPANECEPIPEEHLPGLALQNLMLQVNALSDDERRRLNLKDTSKE